MALQVQRSLQQPQDILRSKWRHRAYATGAGGGGGGGGGGASSRPHVLPHSTSPSSSRAQAQALEPSKQLPGQQPPSSAVHQPGHAMESKSHEPPVARSRPLRSIAPSRPPAAAPAVAPAGRDKKASQFLPIASLLNPHTGVKRRRNSLDVDGPNTASMSSKKRRLRLHLVTSRLSQPYSQPATHIHGRNDAKAVVGRYAAKLEAAFGPQRPPSHGLHANSFLRFSIMNRIRERLGLRGLAMVKAGRADAMDVTPQASWHQQRPSQEPPAKLFSPLPSVAGLGRRTVAGRPDRLLLTRERLLHPAPKTPSQTPPRTVLLAPLSKLAAVDKTDASPLSRGPASPPSTKTENDACEDGFSFLHPEDECLADGPEESQDVYCDFGVLFGKGQPRSPDCGGPRTQGHLDELDGSPWIAR